MSSVISKLLEKHGFIHQFMSPGKRSDAIKKYQSLIEMVVSECVEVCKGQATYDPIVLPYKPSEQFASAIKKHFGVKT